MEDRFNAGVSFDDLYQLDTAERYCVLKSLKYAHGHDKRLGRSDLISAVATNWYYTVSKTTRPPGDRKVRNIIKELRRSGCLIISTGGRKGGYWIPESLSEILLFVTKELVSRAMDLLYTAKKMVEAGQRKYSGQSYMFDLDVRKLFSDIMDM